MSKDAAPKRARAWHLASAVVAIIALAPWAIYLAGLGRLTDQLDGGLSESLRMPQYMLEWYTVSAQFVNIVLIILFGFLGKMNKIGMCLIGFIMCNSAIIIIRATVRIEAINLLDDQGDPKDQLPYLRAEAVGQIASCTFNFLLAILISLAAGEGQSPAAPSSQPPVAA